MRPPPARPGDRIGDIDTPALVVDLDAFERNLATMAEHVAALRPGLRLRPHAKTHKSPVVARRQMALGAVGVCCQKVGEAEALVDGGVDDVLVTNQVVAAPKLRRLASLARRARIGVCVDDAGAARALSEAAVAFGAEVGVLVEIDVGQRRCGVQPGAPAVALARTVAALPGLRFDGLQAYHGSAQHFRTPAERAAAVRRSAELTRGTVEALAAEGLACRTVGGAGTGTYPLEAGAGVWNELQPGSYVFMDADYARNEREPGAPDFAQALFVLAGVMSAPEPGRAVLDAGLKAVATDSGLPLVAGLAGAVCSGMSDEHAVLSLPEGAALAPGDAVWLVPGHCDPTVNLHDWFVGVRGSGGEARVEAVWPVAARGALS